MKLIDWEDYDAVLWLEIAKTRIRYPGMAENEKFGERWMVWKELKQEKSGAENSTKQIT